MARYKITADRDDDDFDEGRIMVFLMEEGFYDIAFDVDEEE